MANKLFGSYHRTARRRKARSFAALAAELLDARALLSASGGTTWADPSSLTLSFVPDGTDVVGQDSRLFDQLDALAPRDVWQASVFRAFQTWATEADINIGIVPDGGEALGTIGATQGDLRFGDIRLASIPLAGDVAALSISSDVAMSGTWVGDILINSESNFESLDQFYAVMLHEAGHVLGLEHSDDPASPMYESLRSDPELAPTRADIAALRAANGARPSDANETDRANDNVKRATRIKYSATSSGYTGLTPLLSYGDITTDRDVDYFTLPTLSGYNGPLTFSLRTDGFSLLAARMTVLDERGRVMAAVSSGGAPGEDLSVTIQHNRRESEYVVRVESDPGAGDFSVGAFALVTTFDARNKVTPETLNEVLRLRYDFLREEELRPIFESGQEPTFFDDAHLDDSQALAVGLKPLTQFADSEEYRATGGISDLSDVDFYSVRSPELRDGESRVMTISVQATRIGGLLASVEVFDGDGNPVAARIVTNNAGTLTVQVSGIESNRTYYVKVGSRLSEGRFATGNYQLSISFGFPEVERRQLSQGQTDEAGGTQGFAMNIHQTQLFQLAMNTTSAGSEHSAVRLTIYDEQGRLLQTIVALAGDTRTGQALLLRAGMYYVQVHALREDGSAAAGVGWSVEGTTMSDPVGPILSDPTTEPPLPDPIYDPIDVIDWPAIIDIPVLEPPLFTDPWTELPDDPFLEPFLDPVTDPDLALDPLFSWYWF